MNVYTYFDADVAREGDGELIRIWRIAWERRGWKPRILTPRSALKHPRHAEAEPGALPLLALAAEGGGWFADHACINYNYSPWTPEVDILKAGFSVGLNFLFATKLGADNLVTAELDREVDRCALVSTPSDHCLALGDEGWETAPVILFSRQGIFRHYGCEAPAWKVITTFERRF